MSPLCEPATYSKHSLSSRGSSEIHADAIWLPCIGQYGVSWCHGVLAAFPFSFIKNSSEYSHKFLESIRLPIRSATGESYINRFISGMTSKLRMVSMNSPSSPSKKRCISWLLLLSTRCKPSSRRRIHSGCRTFCSITTPSFSNSHLTDLVTAERGSLRDSS